MDSILLEKLCQTHLLAISATGPHGLKIKEVGYEEAKK
jgi:hypothetical protein